jgi:flagellin-like hook-associated protein FlgL
MGTSPQTLRIPAWGRIEEALLNGLTIDIPDVTYTVTRGTAANTPLQVIDTYAATVGSVVDRAIVESLFNVNASTLTGGTADLVFSVVSDFDANSGDANGGGDDLILSVSGRYWDETGEAHDLATQIVTITQYDETTLTNNGPINLTLGNGNVLVFNQWARQSQQNGILTTTPNAAVAFLDDSVASPQLFNAGDAYTAFYSDATGHDLGITVTGSDGTVLTYNFDSATVQKGTPLSLLHSEINPAAIQTGSPNPNAVASYGARVTLPTSLAGIGDIADISTKLRDIDLFWNSEGRLLLADPQTITITQGDGKQTKVTIYADDTVEDLIEKLNSAISDVDKLGQGVYVGSDADRFVSFVDQVTARAANQSSGNRAETTAGTIVIRSVIAGSDGRISFAGDEDLIKALSMNVLPEHEARESNYNITISDAHTGEILVDDERITGNRLIGMVHENIDVVFDAMTGITATYDTPTGHFVYDTTISQDTFLHLADNTTVYQIGANEGEDMGVNIGDMRAEALGLNTVLVTDRDLAARSITIIDNAIDKVSMQRAKIGAYQNRLEHSINNLTVAGENLTAAESRIRDTDMAKEMMNFSKLQIMLQAGTSMLAQANTLPQNVLSLLR